jgi:peptide/nickel transport system substrate-binding protein
MASFLPRPRLFLSSLAIALVALCGCSKVSGPGASGAHAWTQPGVLRIGEAYEPKSLNVVLDQSAATGDLSFFIFSYAVRYDNHGRPVPDALSEIPTVQNGDVSKDGKTLIYKLRHNIKWQDGVPLTCADLVFTWHYVMDPKTNISTTDGYRDIASIDCRDRYTAVIHMKRLYAPFLQQLFGVNSNAPILPKHLLASYLKAGTQNTAPYNAMPIGSGPFKVVQWQRNTVVRLVANPYFYLGAPKLKEVDFYSEPDENTLETQIQTHAIDMLARGTPLNWPRYQQIAARPQSGLIAIAPDSYMYDHIDFNEKNPILADLQVRRALTLATSRQAIIEKIMHGASTPSDLPESPTLSWGYTSNVKHYPFDPAQARAMLDADGWHVGPGGIRVKNGEKLALELSTQTENVMGQAIEALVQREWHDIGVAVQVKNYPTAEMFTNGPQAVLMGGHYDVAEFGWTGGADPDVESLYSATNLAPDGQNMLFWINHAATADLEAALQTVDQAARERDYHAFDREFALDEPSFIIGFRRSPFVYNSDLKGFTPSPVISPFWNPWEYSL